MTDSQQLSAVASSDQQSTREKRVHVPQDTPFTPGPSDDFPGFPDVAAGLTAADTARIAAEGLWAADGSVNPEAARLGQTLATALLDENAQDLLPAELAAHVEEVRGVAWPAYHRIEVTDGTRLSAFSLRQLGPGPHPLVVFPAGWTPFGWPLFLWAYGALARRGYHVLAYTPRGLGYRGLPSTSEGFVDVAGPNDVSDGSDVVDFAVDRFGPSVIGFMGESYGSGISQLVAAHDQRVAAVVALSTWGNLATSMYDHRTRHTAAVKALVGFTGGPVEERFDAANQEILRKFDANEDMEAVVDWGRRRAPETYAHLTNRNGTPTFFSNTWHESLFPVNQVLTTFEALTVPKRLNLWIGDHAVPEGAGLIGTQPGLVNLPLAEAYAWLDHHLKGERNGVEEWDRVCGQVMFTYRTEPVLDPGTGEPTGENQVVEPALRESRADWSEVTTAVETFALTGDGAGGGDGALVTGGGETTAPPEGAGWRRSFVAGVDTEATAMDMPIMTTGQAEWAGNPKVYETHKIDRRHALVWTSEPFPADGGAGVPGRRVRGIPRLRLTFRSTAPSATLVAHLLDVAADDTARIISHEPCTAYDLTPDEDTTATWNLQAAAYDIPAGHRLMLVVDSMDPLYGDEATVTWTQTTIGSPDGLPSFLELPLG
ncbi:alpha/beta fold hydrolase [Streptomyces sp. NPDC056144]|uniref:alpha/beta fold hydrolase n=1 Tax=Streptomyces sp. NPDC056144 TaxID=3345726 RepID=UPI0035DCBCD2